MPPPAMPPPASFSGLSATTASVVRNRAAIEAAFCSAERVTLAASMTPIFTRSSYSPVAALRPSLPVRLLTLLDDDAAFHAGVLGDLLERGLEALGDQAGAGGLVAGERVGNGQHRGLRTQQRHATAGHDALFDGGLGGGHASSMRCFFSFSSTSVAAPTFSTATPPVSLARRSWSFSRS